MPDSRDRAGPRQLARPAPVRGTRDHCPVDDGRPTRSRRELRASDADRERACEFVREHAGEGRLTVDELEDRIGRALQAKTLGDLDDLVVDLPPLPADRRRAPERARWQAALPGVRSWARYAAIVLLVVGLVGAGPGRELMFIPWLWIAVVVFFVRNARRAGGPRAPHHHESDAPYYGVPPSPPAEPLEWHPPEIGERG